MEGKPERSEAQKEAVRRWMRNNSEYWKAYQVHKYHERMQNPEERAKLNAKARERYQAKTEAARKEREARRAEKGEKREFRGRPRKYENGYDPSLFVSRKKAKEETRPEELESV